MAGDTGSEGPHPGALPQRAGPPPTQAVRHAADDIDIRQWHSGFGKKTPTQRAHTYGLLRTILRTAVTDGLIDVCPANIRGAGTSQRVHKIRPATLAELEKTHWACRRGTRRWFCWPVVAVYGWGS